MDRRRSDVIQDKFRLYSIYYLLKAASLDINEEV